MNRHYTTAETMLRADLFQPRGAKRKRKKGGCGMLAGALFLALAAVLIL